MSLQDTIFDISAALEGKPERELFDEFIERFNVLEKQISNKTISLNFNKSKESACGNSECNGINSGIDKCIQPLVTALNDCGMETAASCCGHNRTIGNVCLKDGRVVLIIPDFDTGKRIWSLFPDIHGNTRDDMLNQAVEEIEQLQKQIRDLESSSATSDIEKLTEDRKHSLKLCKICGHKLDGKYCWACKDFT